MQFSYTGYRTLVYFKYLDRLAEHTLVADPGGEYEILATESGLPVPPGDGRWIPAPTPEPPQIKLPPVQKETKADSAEDDAASSDKKAGE